jgi:NAD+ kinase
MTSVLFTAFTTRPDAVALATHAIATLKQRGITSDFCALDDVSVAVCDAATLVVSLGGDGTFLRSARLAHAAGSRVLAVNLGRVGFLLDVAAHDVVERITEALGTNDAVDRLALDVLMPDGASVFALNEVVVERSAPGHMVHVTTFIDDNEFLTYSADGVMVATPTGSTGYSFSAGGPMVSAELQLLVVTPIAPHFTIDRSIVVGPRSTVRLQMSTKPALVVADSLVVGTLSADQSVTVRRSQTPVRVVRSTGFDMGSRLRASLRQGHA